MAAVRRQWGNFVGGIVVLDSFSGVVSSYCAINVEWSFYLWSFKFRWLFWLFEVRIRVPKKKYYFLFFWLVKSLFCCSLFYVKNIWTSQINLESVIKSDTYTKKITKLSPKNLPLKWFFFSKVSTKAKEIQNFSWTVIFVHLIN